MVDLSGRVALVTGASRGIGRAIASLLAKKGAFVIGTATSQAGAEAITSMFQEQQWLGEGCILDVSQQDSVDSLMSHLDEHKRNPAILVNNAGITADNLLLRMENDEWNSVIETNLSSVYRMSKACLRAMVRARFGRIINVGSVVASCGNAGQSNYTAAKAGLIGFSKSLAAEIGSRNITVNVVSPGFIDTEMTAVLPDMIKEEMLKRIPLKRLGHVNDIAEIVAFLASDVAGYITGETIHVNGGMYMA